MTALDLPSLSTTRLRLDPVGPRDAEDLQRLTDDAAILSAVHFLPDPFTLFDARQLIAGAGDGREAFVGGRLHADKTLVAVCGLHLLGEEAVEIGYWVGTAFEGRGLAREAVGAVVTWLRDREPQRLIFAECRPANHKSWRLLEAIGFRATGEPGRRPGRMRLAM